MDEPKIELAAKLVKILHLAGSPGMDSVAVKLNCGPTHDELRRARMWAKAFELAERGGKPFDLAAELHQAVAR